MKLLSQRKALERLHILKDDFREEIVAGYEHAAKSCLTCETQGACCLDAHFVNVRISRLEAVAINNVLRELPGEHQQSVYKRIEDTIETYGLGREGGAATKTFACPLFEKSIGCLVHKAGKPLPCITHACYEDANDLPPDELLQDKEIEVDKLNERTYGRSAALLPLPIAVRSAGKMPALSDDGCLARPPQSAAEYGHRDQ